MKPTQLTPDHSITLGLSIVVGEAADAAILNAFHIQHSKLFLSLWGDICSHLYMYAENYSIKSAYSDPLYRHKNLLTIDPLFGYFKISCQIYQRNN